jgi:hypothetical protein
MSAVVGHRPTLQPMPLLTELGFGLGVVLQICRAAGACSARNSAPFGIPKGFKSFSPGLARSDYPGSIAPKHFPTPTGLHPPFSRIASTPSGLRLVPNVPQRRPIASANAGLKAGTPLEFAIHTGARPSQLRPKRNLCSPTRHKSPSHGPPSVPDSLRYCAAVVATICGCRRGRASLPPGKSARDLCDSREFSSASCCVRLISAGLGSPALRQAGCPTLQPERGGGAHQPQHLRHGKPLGVLRRRGVFLGERETGESNYCWSRRRTLLGMALACANIAVPDCTRMFDFAYWVLSSATSTSMMRELAAVRFSELTLNCSAV